MQSILLRRGAGQGYGEYFSPCPHSEVLTMERKLAAILAADVVGYSRLMAENEANTFDRLMAHHQWTRESSTQALSHFYRAIELDPNFAAAYGWAARCYSQRKVGG